MFKRLLQALNDNAQLIHDYYCGVEYQEPNKPIPIEVFCKHCGQEIDIHDDDTHVCTSMEIPK